MPHTFNPCKISAILWFRDASYRHESVAWYPFLGGCGGPDSEIGDKHHSHTPHVLGSMSKLGISLGLPRPDFPAVNTDGVRIGDLTVLPAPRLNQCIVQDRSGRWSTACPAVQPGQWVEMIRAVLIGPETCRPRPWILRVAPNRTR